MIFTKRFFENFFRNKLAVLGLALIIFFILVAIFAPILSPYSPELQNPTYNGIPQAPSWIHFFGTDNYGRDQLSRAIYGTRISLAVGICSVAIYMLIGILLGAISGYYGGIVDTIIMRLCDIMLSIPVFFFILALQVIFTPSVFNVILVIGFTGWAAPARLMRSQTLSVKESLFVKAACSYGASSLHIIRRHIIPNSMSPMIVMATLGVASAILMESTLSFLGLGVQEPASSWGNMLMRAQEYISTAPWMSIFPGILIMLIVLAFNFLGEGIRDALDPKLNI